MKINVCSSLLLVFTGSLMASLSDQPVRQKLDVLREQEQLREAQMIALYVRFQELHRNIQATDEKLQAVHRTWDRVEAAQEKLRQEIAEIKKNRTSWIDQNSDDASPSPRPSTAVPKTVSTSEELNFQSCVSSPACASPLPVRSPVDERRDELCHTY